MNKIVIFVALILVFSLVGCAKQQVQTAPQQTQQQNSANEGRVTFEVLPNVPEVRISGFAFNPSNLTVSIGETVKWINDDSVAHTVTSDGNFRSGELKTGDSYEFRFATPGIYDYSCSIHPSMKGTVLVK